MDKWEIIDYLEQYKNLDRHIDRLLEEKEHWKSRAEKITPTITGMPQGGDGEDQRELAICKMVDCDRQATEEIDRLVDLKRGIMKAIDSVEEDGLRLVLEYQYITGLTNEKIAERMDCSDRNIRYMKNKALKAISLYFRPNE